MPHAHRIFCTTPSLKTNRRFSAILYTNGRRSSRSARTPDRATAPAPTETMPMKGSKSGAGQSVGAVNEKRKKINARVLRKVDEVYKAFPAAAAGERKEGLVKYSEYLDKLLKRFNVLDGAGKPVEVSLHAPRSKVSVMIVGNHSSGKSSFINWYINEKLLGTSMAIETKGLIFVTQGKVKDVWEKEGTLRKFPEIADIATELKDPAVVNCLETHFSQSDERLFSMVNFIDTPGLVDGHVEYPFDVNKGIVYMAKHVDKILIFLDPMGKATVTRTMDVIKALQEDYQEKTSFYMTKADQIDSQSDIMDVIAQTVRDMKSAITHEHNFKLPTIFIPSIATKDASDRIGAANHIGDLCKEIETVSTRKAQKNLERLKNDAKALHGHATQLLKVNKEMNSAKSCRSNLAMALYLVSVSMILLSFLWMVVAFNGILPAAISENELYGEIVVAAKPWVTADPDAGMLARLMSTGKFIASFCVVTFLASFVSRRSSQYTTLSDAEVAKVSELVGVFDLVQEEHDKIWEAYSSDIDGQVA